jgi:charged multivesicular body protein 7
LLGSKKSELSRERVVIPFSSFQSSSKSVYSSSWPAWIFSNIVSKPLWWALSHTGIVEDTSSSDTFELWKKTAGDYVWLPLVEVRYCFSPAIVALSNCYTLKLTVTHGYSQQAADSVVELLRLSPRLGVTDRLFSFQAFRTQFASKALPGVSLTDRDLRVLLRFLQRDRRVLAFKKEVRFPCVTYCL